ncbi:hypothetical protein K469DRAFT_698656 [Zopfia rhizophila CBS 207.26]|uniref:Uncharacterized protein n=1 Tax=Zopfia rhizophila CBS 207.26 TaxID=1314779 RepID=A0A6A6EV79_9PEZI|nr:hypothetical protein K469DRAFT_698656 [Zopfia rhizophila CBS 207.26]
MAASYSGFLANPGMPTSEQQGFGGLMGSVGSSGEPVVFEKDFEPDDTDSYDSQFYTSSSTPPQPAPPITPSQPYPLQQQRIRLRYTPKINNGPAPTSSPTNSMPYGLSASGTSESTPLYHAEMNVGSTSCPVLDDTFGIGQTTS